MTVSAIFQFAGGIGLFLLGMRLMTDGLKVAAGAGLRAMLTRGTTTRARAVASGVAVTALVQSSSAVTFATLGFVSAGLLALPQAVGVIYGANVGTTVTSWLVALVGLKFDVKLLALPLLAIGMAMRVATGATRTGAAGDALAGLGLFFLGIEVLKGAFTSAGAEWALGVDGAGMLHSLTYLGIGFAMTVVMQSSSAALVVTLSAVSAGTLPLAAGAALVIGANLGTTTTAVLAVIGATATAKRSAVIHVAFNLAVAVVGVAALPFLPTIFSALGFGPVVVLALFHTTINVAGLLVMWPLTTGLIGIVERRFITLEDDLSRPRFLDANATTTPAVALAALAAELDRAREMARSLAESALRSSESDVKRVRRRAALDELLEKIREFAVAVGGEGLDVDALSRMLRVNQYLADVAERCAEYATYGAEEGGTESAEISTAQKGLIDHALAVLTASRVSDELLAAFEAEYQTAKSTLLRAGAERKLPVRTMTVKLDRISALRRLLDQWAKASQHLDAA